ncbi:MAG: DUF4149 domain-containing protein [Gammaproteobacteria bacterium]|nr:DUF4149 domain-containing protein [Gammaproteobacteria bacterium]NNL99625.1 DUF4149 domain-containing protein [Gammaproteobacteria bacterium]
MYDLTEAYLMTAYICALAALLGALLFGGGALAPLAVRVLDEPAAARLLRAYWPRYYKTAIAIGGVLTLIVFATSPLSALPGMFCLLLGALAALMTTCFFIALQLIPAINAARDAGDTTRFDRLHRVDVALTGVGLLTGAVLLALLVYVLPGQFTYTV